MISATIDFIIEIILVYILIVFLIIPGLGWMLGVEQPIGAIVSGSMEHDGNFTNWWEQHDDMYKVWNISEKQFKSFPYKNGLNIGDLVIFKAAKDIEIGDIILVKDFEDVPILHRVVSTEPLDTLGDANFGQLGDSERSITPERIMGKIAFRMPYIGYVRYWVEYVRGK